MVFYCHLVSSTTVCWEPVCFMTFSRPAGRSTRKYSTHILHSASQEILVNRYWLIFANCSTAENAGSQCKLNTHDTSPTDKEFSRTDQEVLVRCLYLLHSSELDSKKHLFDVCTSQYRFLWGSLRVIAEVGGAGADRNTIYTYSSST